jgi:type II secretory pathway pseudopilin PulG
MARIKAFTLIEFLLVATTIAAIAAILLPVTALAKQTALRTTTSTNLRLIGMAANMYAHDYDYEVVRTQQSQIDSDHLWAVAMSPYLSTRATFFDPTRPVPTTATVTVLPGTTQPWYRVVNLSINDAGYTGRWVTQGNTCAGRKIGYLYGRSLSAMSDPNKRVAFAPTTWGGTNVGWYAFHANEASWISPLNTTNQFTWSNQVWDTRSLFKDAIPVVHADGSAGKLTRGDFKDTNEAKTVAAYCSWMSSEGMDTWGAFWNGN